jgi:glycosyltransferase involved in cell wall biosynthesis
MADVRIAWFTPLQPIESGISLYSEDLLPFLAESVNIDVFVDRYKPNVLTETRSLRVRSAGEFNPKNYDLVVYQMGNSPAHLYMLEEVTRTPGLLVLHDTVLNHLFVQQAARNGTLGNYRAEMQRRYGPDGARAADRVLKGQAPDDLFRFPMSESLIDASRMTIVHSGFARRQILDWCCLSTSVVRVPHGLRMPEYVDRSTARQALGIPADQFIIASITHINPYKRLDVVLRAFRQVRREIPARLVLAGSVSPNYPIRRTIAHLGLDQVIDLEGYVTDQHSRLLAAAADVIVNLRYPTAGETSGSLLHSMAAGRPVIVSETGSFTEVPRDSVLTVPVDELEENMLVALFRRLASDHHLRDVIGTRARAFVQNEHSMQRWVDGYIEVINRLTNANVPRPIVQFAEEPVLEGATPVETSMPDPLLQEIAISVAELGLGGDDELFRDVAQSTVELGLGIGKIKQHSDAER